MNVQHAANLNERLDLPAKDLLNPTKCWPYTRPWFHEPYKRIIK